MGTPQSVLIVLISLLVIEAVVPTYYWDSHVLWHCPVKAYLMPLIFSGHCPTSGFFVDCRCPGCGITHALSALMHGNFQAAIHFNFLIVPVVILILYLMIDCAIKLSARNKK